MTTGTSWDDRRSEPREPVSLRARAAYGAGLSAWADCTVRNISPKGMMIEVGEMYPLPKRFVVLLIAEGVAVDVDMKWRRSAVTGLRIAARHDLATTEDPRLTGLKKDWQVLSGQG
jgi:hypothetical protein